MKHGEAWQGMAVMDIENNKVYFDNAEFLGWDNLVFTSTKAVYYWLMLTMVTTGACVLLMILLLFIKFHNE